MYFLTALILKKMLSLHYVISLISPHALTEGAFGLNETEQIWPDTLFV